MSTVDNTHTPQPGEASEYVVSTILKSSSHPTVLIFHLLFRTSAFITFLIPSSNFVLVFVLVTLFLAFDFWTVKNVSGRRLVGLRWWNEIKEDGENTWVFESRDQKKFPINRTDYWVFWISLYVYLILWIVFAIIEITKPMWLGLCILAISLNMANVVGYTKCERDAKKNLQGFVAQGLMSGLMGGGGGFFQPPMASTSAV